MANLYGTAHQLSESCIQMQVIQDMGGIWWSVLTPDMLVLVQKQWIPLLLMRVGKIIGGVHLHVLWQGP